MSESEVTNPHQPFSINEKVGDFDDSVKYEKTDLSTHFNDIRSLLRAYSSRDQRVNLLDIKVLIDDTIRFSVDNSDVLDGRNVTDDVKKYLYIEYRFLKLRRRNFELYRRIRQNFSSKNIRLRKYKTLDNKYMYQAIQEATSDLKKILDNRHRSVSET